MFLTKKENIYIYIYISNFVISIIWVNLITIDMGNSNSIISITKKKKKKKNSQQFYNILKLGSYFANESSSCLTKA